MSDKLHTKWKFTYHILWKTNFICADIGYGRWLCELSKLNSFLAINLPEDIQPNFQMSSQTFLYVYIYIYIYFQALSYMY